MKLGCSQIALFAAGLLQSGDGLRVADKPNLRIAAAQLGRRDRSIVAANQTEPFPVEFFADDAQRMAAMPAYDNVAHTNRAAIIKGSSSQICDPRCNWKCGPHIECNQVCEPQCAPPKCHTLCSRREENCETRCGPPRCAVVCPHSDAESDCVDGKCGRCKTVCSPPLCTTQCGDDCQNVCEQPLCLWKCQKPEVCPKPHCDLHCSGFARCAVGLDPQHGLPLEEKMGTLDEHIYSQSNASLDPMSMYAPASAPPPWPLAEHTSSLPQREEALTKGSGDAPARLKQQRNNVDASLAGPVRALKLKWAADDTEQRD